MTEQQRNGGSGSHGMRRYVAACAFSFVVMAASTAWAIHVGNEAAAIEHELLHTSVAVSLLKAELEHLQSPRARPGVKP